MQYTCFEFVFGLLMVSIKEENAVSTEKRGFFLYFDERGFLLRMFPDDFDIHPPIGRVPTFNFIDDDANLPPFVREVEGPWNVVYSWPPIERQRRFPDSWFFVGPSKLETAVFGCRCGPEKFCFMAPMKIEDHRLVVNIYGTQMVTTEAEVLPALNRNTCPCRVIPLADKFVLLPIGEEFLLKYIRLPGAEYTAKNFCHVYLLHRQHPTLAEIQRFLSGMELNDRPGRSTYVRNEPGQFGL